MSLPANLKYTADHEWLAADGEVSTVGITVHAADALGEVVYVSLPAVGDTVIAGQSCGEIESTKSVSDLYAPADGEIVEVNDAVVADPAVINSDPFGGGWLFKLRITGAPDLLDTDAYAALTEGA
ncbi:glycine cleavage system H protein [Catenulispora sp. MAP5-51]|uniref:glycine cleavage system protein GcvH n=1 Tax=Catenulispora sp. MAP5-51 TaxID=3156298 RepID=UPI003519D1B6